MASGGDDGTKMLVRNYLTKRDEHSITFRTNIMDIIKPEQISDVDDKNLMEIVTFMNGTSYNLGD
jgi:hypothetical protein